MAGGFWKNKRVFLTGQTGFKGSWLSLWLAQLGAEVTGYALEPPTTPSLFQLCRVENLIKSVTGDIRDFSRLKKTLFSAKPEIVIHMAAQPLVRESYKVPVDTYSTNVMGTVNLLEAAKGCSSVKALVNVTTDKCYENSSGTGKKNRGTRSFKENAPLGGYDPYSSSKACSELVTTAYRNSYFNPQHYSKHGVALASARAGNVIGGGDWAADRLIPDFIRAILKNKKVIIRNPKAVRPWQHVLEPLSGYLQLAEKLYKSGPKFAEAWNFGPDMQDDRSVEWIIKKLCQKWGKSASYAIDNKKHPHEAFYLRLDSSKARKELGWQPQWDLETAIGKIVEWTKSYQRKENLLDITYGQIDEYENARRKNGR